MHSFCSAEIILKKHVWPAIICFYLRLGLIYIYLSHSFSLPKINHFLFVLSSSSSSSKRKTIKLISSIIIIYYLLFTSIQDHCHRVSEFIVSILPNMKPHKSFGIANGLSECSIYIRNWIFGKNSHPLKFQ